MVVLFAKRGLKMNGKFRRRGSGLVASSLILSACVPGALQTQAHFGEALLSFFSRTIVYMLWSRSNLIKKCQEKLIELNGGNVLTDFKNKILKSNDLSEELKIKLTQNFDEALKKLKSNVSGEEIAKFVSENLSSYMDDLDVAINKIKEKENLYILSKSKESLLVEKLYDYSYMSNEDFEGIMKKIQDNESGQKIKFSFFPKGKEEEFYSLPYLNSEIKKLEENVQQKTEEAIAHFLINFVKKVEEKATKEAEESEKRLKFQKGLGEDVFSVARRIITKAFGEDESDSFLSKAKEYILALTRLRIQHNKKVEEKAENIKKKEDAKVYKKKKYEEKEKTIKDRLKELEEEGDIILENSVNFFMSNIGKVSMPFDKWGNSVGYFLDKDEGLSRLINEAVESKNELSSLKKEMEKSKECVKGLGNKLAPLENFKKSLKFLKEEEINAIFDLAGIYDFVCVQESKNWEECLDNYDFFEKMYSRFRELGIRKIKENDFLKSCREEREKLEDSKGVLARTKEDFSDSMKKINTSKKNERKYVEHLMKYFQSNRFYRSTDTSGGLVDWLLYGKNFSPN